MLPPWIDTNTPFRNGSALSSWRDQINASIARNGRKSLLSRLACPQVNQLMKHGANMSGLIGLAQKLSTSREVVVRYVCLT
jgi:hypothetical protein